MNLRRPLRPLLVPAAALLLGACASFPTGPAAIEGEIVARDAGMSTGARTVHVVGDPTDGCGIIFSSDGRTRIVRLGEGGRRVSTSVNELRVGDTVRVWAEMVMTSCPAQSGARAIEIIPG